MFHGINSNLDAVTNRRNVTFCVGDVFTYAPGKITDRYGLFMILGFIEHQHNSLNSYSVVFRSLNDATVANFHITSIVADGAKKIV